MTEALQLIIDFAFKELEQNQIWAGTFVLIQIHKNC